MGNYTCGNTDLVIDGSLINFISTLILLIQIIIPILLIFFGEEIFSIFIPEKEAIIQGADYLRILGYSQLFMCIEITTAGAFYGMGKTLPPSTISILFTGARIPLALFLSQPNVLGINGVWWAITLTSVFKGILLFGIFKFKGIKELRELEKAKSA